MATAKKKPAAKKSSRTKSSPAKTASRTKTVSYSQASERKFLQTKFTEQTIYWLIIGAAVIALAVWVLSIQVKMDEMYDSMDAAAQNTVMPQKQDESQ